MDDRDEVFDVMKGGESDEISLQRGEGRVRLGLDLLVGVQLVDRGQTFQLHTQVSEIPLRQALDQLLAALHTTVPSQPAVL